MPIPVPFHSPPFLVLASSFSFLLFCLLIPLPLSILSSPFSFPNCLSSIEILRLIDNRLANAGYSRVTVGLPKSVSAGGSFGHLRLSEQHADGYSVTRYDFLFVFYGEFNSRGWKRCRVISRQSAKLQPPKRRGGRRKKERRGVFMERHFRYAIRG